MDATWLAANWQGIAGLLAVAGVVGITIRLSMMRAGRDTTRAGGDVSRTEGSVIAHVGSGGGDVHSAGMLGQVCAGVAALQTAMADLARDRRVDIEQRTEDRGVLRAILQSQEEQARAFHQVAQMLQQAYHGQAMSEMHREVSESHERIEAAHRERLRAERSVPQIPTRNG
jgi:hypothetical protein